MNAILPWVRSDASAFADDDRSTPVSAEFIRPDHDADIMIPSHLYLFVLYLQFNWPVLEATLANEECGGGAAAAAAAAAAQDADVDLDPGAADEAWSITLSVIVHREEDADMDPADAAAAAFADGRVVEDVFLTVHPDHAVHWLNSQSITLRLTADEIRQRSVPAHKRLFLLFFNQERALVQQLFQKRMQFALVAGAPVRSIVPLATPFRISPRAARMCVGAPSESSVRRAALTTMWFETLVRCDADTDTKRAISRYIDDIYPFAGDWFDAHTGRSAVNSLCATDVGPNEWFYITTRTSAPAMPTCAEGGEEDEECQVLFFALDAHNPSNRILDFAKRAVVQVRLADDDDAAVNAQAEDDMVWSDLDIDEETGVASLGFGLVPNAPLRLDFRICARMPAARDVRASCALVPFVSVYFSGDRCDITGANAAIVLRPQGSPRSHAPIESVDARGRSPYFFGGSAYCDAQTVHDCDWRPAEHAPLLLNLVEQNAHASLTDAWGVAQPHPPAAPTPVPPDVLVDLEKTAVGIVRDGLLSCVADERLVVCDATMLRDIAVDFLHVYFVHALTALRARAPSEEPRVAMDTFARSVLSFVHPLSVATRQVILKHAGLTYGSADAIFMSLLSECARVSLLV